MHELTSDETRPAEAAPLASEMSAAYRRHVECYQEQLGLSPSEAAARTDEVFRAKIERAAEGDPKYATFSDLAALAQVDPERCEQRWREIRTAARMDFLSGHRAAKGLETAASGEVWPRASHLALREELAAQWKPQGGVELALIDTMALAWTSQVFWHERMMIYACIETDNDRVKREGRWETPRVADADAVEQAGRMADRFNRIFIRSLRALRDLRRHAPTLIVQNARQVNVGEQQVNLSAAPAE